MVGGYRPPEPLLHPRAYQPWSEEEDICLVKEFSIHMPIEVIAERHGRSEGSIRSRMPHLYDNRMIIIRGDE
jgi:hypothetical protein